MLREYMKMNNYTANELARECNVSDATIYNILHETTNASFTSLRKISEATNLQLIFPIKFYKTVYSDRKVNIKKEKTFLPAHVYDYLLNTGCTVISYTCYKRHGEKAILDELNRLGLSVHIEVEKWGRDEPTVILIHDGPYEAI